MRINVSYTDVHGYLLLATYSTHKVKLPSYTLANLGVNKVADSLTIYANLNNVFNKKYETLLGYGQEGRNVYVGLKARSNYYSLTRACLARLFIIDGVAYHYLCKKLA